MANDKSLKLTLFRLGDKPDKTFSIRVFPSSKVAELIPEIKRGYEQLATGGTLSGIALYQVDTWIKQLSELEDPPESSYPLILINSVEDYWPGPEHINVWNVHILIKAQVVEIQPREESAEPVSPSEIEQLASRQDETAEEFRDIPSASVAARPEEFREQQEGEAPIYNGRPFGRTGIPIELFHPAFNIFATRLKQTENLSASQYTHVEKFMFSSQAFHLSDSHRWCETKSLVASAIGYPVHPDETFSNQSGGVVLLTDTKSGRKPYGAFIEISAEMGVGDFDLSVKGAESYATCWSQEQMTALSGPACFVIFLLTTARVLDDRAQTSYALSFIDHLHRGSLDLCVRRRRHPQQNQRQMRVVRIFDAITATLAALEEYYTPFINPETISINHQRFFPHMRWVQTTDGPIHFSYKRRLGEPDFLRSLFEAITEDGRRIMRVVRIFDAITATLAALEEYYTPFINPETISINHQRFFPHMRWVQTTDGPIHFSYKCRLGEPDFLRSLFEAITEDGRRIVVKFTESYHLEAHKLLADRSLAPTLLSLHAEPVGGNLLMVVMELSGTSLDRYLASHPKLDRSKLDRVRTDVQDALEILHAHNLVFGDLRTPNVLVTRAMRGQLVDFDWCGFQGEARYPIGINQNRDLGWAVGVEKGSLMFKVHDKLMLKRLFLVG
ncbi:hypothetical protein RSAG8_12571, partial [Rhizoctonia solani AG-8 WAC10335]